MSEAKKLSLEARVAALEAELARVSKLVGAKPGAGDPWLEDVVGAFAGDPLFLKAMQYGREYRESLRPKPRKKRVRQ